jgi:hypothetical protein
VGRPHQSQCGGMVCGARLIIPIVRVIAAGRGCPSLDGQSVTEQVTPARLQPGERRCGASLQTGPGCVMDSNGFMQGSCLDEYALCGGINQFPQGTCVERFDQEYLIGSRVIARNQIAFTVTNNRETDAFRCGTRSEFEPGENIDVAGPAVGP